MEYSSESMITPAMLSLRESSLVERKRVYRSGRIKDQLDWYRKKASWNKNKGQAWFIGLIIVNAIAIVCALIKTALPDLGHWPTDVFVAAAAAILGWVQTKRFHEISATYTLTAHEIMLMDATFPIGNSEEAFSLFIGDAENAFSREHTQWQARRDKD